MLDKIEYYDPSGGYTVNLKRKIVYSDDNRMGSEVISESNIYKVEYVIKETLKFYTKKIEDYKQRLLVTKRQIITIKDSVKYREPLKGSKRERVENKIVEFGQYIEDVNNIDLKELLVKVETEQ